MKVRLKRVYEPKDGSDGLRILVERLWPRGMTKEAAGVDIWLKEISPSPALRRWYAHDEAKWPEFQRRYRAEIAANKEALAELRKYCVNGATFLFAAKDEKRNSAAVLKAYLENSTKEETA